MAYTGVLAGSAEGVISAPDSTVSTEALTVLVVDDDTAVLSVVARHVARCGYRVRTASSPAEAIRLASADAGVDLLVSDVRMPGLSGPELYRGLARQLPGLKVLYISGYPGFAPSAGEDAFGGAPFLAKPFTARELAAALRVALSQRPSLSPVPA